MRNDSFSFLVHSTHIYLPMKMEQSVPKCRHINSRRGELPKRKHTMYMFRSPFSQDIETRLLQAWYGKFFELFVFAARYRDFIWKLPQNDHWLQLRRCLKDIPFITFVCLVITLSTLFVLLSIVRRKWAISGLNKPILKALDYSIIILDVIIYALHISPNVFSSLMVKGLAMSEEYHLNLFRLHSIGGRWMRQECGSLVGR
jgi:hypothetical protein